MRLDRDQRRATHESLSVLRGPCRLRQRAMPFVRRIASDGRRCRLDAPAHAHRQDRQLGAPAPDRRGPHRRFVDGDPRYYSAVTTPVGTPVRHLAYRLGSGMIEAVMIQIERILYPTDFSDTSLHALLYAKNFAEQYRAKLHCLYVIDEAYQYWMSMGPDSVPAGPVLPDLEASSSTSPTCRSRSRARSRSAGRSWRSCAPPATFPPI